MTRIHSLILSGLVVILVAGSAEAQRRGMWSRGPQNSSDYRVRLAYIVPSDRKPRPGYAETIRELALATREFYADQMERHGLGRKTFRLERDPENGEPVVHLIEAGRTAAGIAGRPGGGYEVNDHWTHTIEAFEEGGFEPYAPGEAWLLVVDTHAQLENGSLTQVTSQGDGRTRWGLAMVDASTLVLGTEVRFSDHRNYHGRVLPGLGPHTLRREVSFPWYAGRALSNLAAVARGTVVHELGHAFQLGHVYLGDDVFNGVIMGNGFRGFRGYVNPKRFAAEDHPPGPGETP